MRIPLINSTTATLSLRIFHGHILVTFDFIRDMEGPTYSCDCKGP